jgi:hypothetical protein
MVATKTRPRTNTARTTAKPGTRSVEEMLREIAYVLHVTRKINQELDLPIVAGPARSAVQPA